MRRGIQDEIGHVREVAEYFRKKIENLPFRMFTSSPSSAATALTPLNGVSAYRYFERLDREYNIWVCPNGGELRDKVFRVGHMGDVGKEDYDRLVGALHKIVEEKI